MKTCSICPNPSTDYYGLTAYVNCVDSKHIDLHAEATLVTKIQDRGEFKTVRTGGYGGCIPGPLCKEHYTQILESLMERTKRQIEILNPERAASVP